MKILLFGEYSNVHYTLCQSLRRAGHEVLLVSDGDDWKNYPRDVDVRRKCPGKWGSALLLLKLLTLLPRLRGYDVVQLINPAFLYLKPRWNRWMFSYLKRHNKLMCLGCFGDDYYVLSRMQQPDFLAYTEFFAQGHTLDFPINRERICTWCSTERRALTEYVVAHSDCLLACLYEYYKVYADAGFGDKLHYMPLPVEKKTAVTDRRTSGNSVKMDNAGKEGLVAGEKQKVRILLAVQKKRTQMKGTDQIEPLLCRLAAAYPDQLDLHRIESVPFEQYCAELEAADVVVDQLYSYTPAMGALEAMSRGKVVITGGEAYELEGEHYQAPVINLRPGEEEENERILRQTLLDRKKIAQLSADSQAYVEKYHDADKVAQRCVEIYSSLTASRFLFQR